MVLSEMRESRKTGKKGTSQVVAGVNDDTVIPFYSSRRQRVQGDWGETPPWLGRCIAVSREGVCM